MPLHTSSTILKCSAGGLRSFLGRPVNLPQISNPDLKLEVLSAPDQVIAGGRIEFRIHVYGFRQKAIHEYIQVDESAIVETQVDGPMRIWRHSQLILARSSGECQLTGEIEFEPPRGMLGYLLTEERILESLGEGMEFRYSALQELIELGTVS